MATLGDAFIIQLTQELTELRTELQRLKTSQGALAPADKARFEARLNKLRGKVAQRAHLTSMVVAAEGFNVDGLKRVLAEVLDLVDQLEDRKDWGSGLMSGQTQKMIKQRQEITQLKAILAQPSGGPVYTAPVQGTPTGDPSVAIALGLSIIFDVIKGWLGGKDRDR